MSKTVYVAMSPPKTGSPGRPVRVFDDEQPANDWADTEQRVTHDLVRHARLSARDRGVEMRRHGLSGAQPLAPLPDPGKGCDRPSIHPVEFEP